MNPKVDAYLREAEKWREESKTLRKIIVQCGLTEEFKWGKPCYTFRESNVAVIQGFKEYCAVLFCKGALLKDAKGVLTKPGENTQGARQMRFTSLREVVGLEPVLKAYLREAVEAEKAGLKVAYKKNPEPLAEELKAALDRNPALRRAFNQLTPGRQRAYNLYFSAAKQSKTRESRIEKSTRRILGGKGLND